MGKITFSKDTDLERLCKRLSSKGYIVKRRLPDGSYVIYKKGASEHSEKKRGKEGEEK